MHCFMQRGLNIHVRTLYTNGLQKTRKYSRSTFAPAWLHCGVACCALFYNPAIVRRSALCLRSFRALLPIFRLSPFRMVHRTPTCAHTGNSDAGDTMFQFASRFSWTTHGNHDTAAPSFPFAREYEM